MHPHCWSHRKDSNPQLFVYKTNSLPFRRRWHCRETNQGLTLALVPCLVIRLDPTLSFERSDPKETHQPVCRPGDTVSRVVIQPGVNSGASSAFILEGVPNITILGSFRPKGNVGEHNSSPFLRQPCFVLFNQPGKRLEHF
jgi:hypothetical protein